MVEMLVDPGTVVLPGDRVMAEIGDTTVCLGPGLVRAADGAVVVDKAGIVRQRGTTAFYVDSFHPNYVPSKGEYVIGVVKGRAGDYFTLDIGSNFDAVISFLAFENATKKNRPNVHVGDVIYGRLVLSVNDTEPEMVCIDAHGKKQGMGVLHGGHSFDIPIHHARRLLNPNCRLLELLGAEIKYEVTIGLNGVAWVKAPAVRDTLAVKRAILELNRFPRLKEEQIAEAALNWRADMPDTTVTETNEEPELIEVDPDETMEEDGEIGEKKADVSVDLPQIRNSEKGGGRGRGRGRGRKRF